MLFRSRRTRFTRVSNRPVYQCSCGYQVSLLAGTIFEKSSTPLMKWFYALFIVVKTDGNVTAKQLQREIGVTYKTAWRMSKNIKALLHEKKKKRSISSIVILGGQTVGEIVHRAIYQLKLKIVKG